MTDYDEREELEENEGEEGVETESVSSADKHDNFLRLSAGRVQKAGKYIEALGKLSNKSSYAYSKEEVEKIFSYLQRVLDDTKELFAEKEKTQFTW